MEKQPEPKQLQVILQESDLDLVKQMLDLALRTGGIKNLQAVTRLLLVFDKASPVVSPAASEAKAGAAVA